LDEVLLDTHVLLWWLAEHGKLSKPARSAIGGAMAIAVSAISFWEVGVLVAKGRVSLDRPTRAWVNDVVGLPRVTPVALNPDVAVAAAELEGFHGDPADRILVATALDRSIPLISKDRSIHSWARTHQLDCIW